MKRDFRLRSGHADVAGYIVQGHVARVRLASDASVSRDADSIIQIEAGSPTQKRFESSVPREIGRNYELVAMALGGNVYLIQFLEGLFAILRIVRVFCRLSRGE